MYSETFFLILNDTWKNFITSKSDSEVEYSIYNELKSPAYSNLRQIYLKEDKEFPSVILTNCALLSKNLSVLTNNNAIEYNLQNDSLHVCNNYLMSE